MGFISKAAVNVLQNCMAVKRDEKLLIVTDSEKREIAKTFLDASRKASRHAEILEIPIGKINGHEPPGWAAKKMLGFDVILVITSKSISHTKARMAASEKGSRIASMPGITEGIIKRTLLADYSLIRDRNERIIQKIKKAGIIRVKTEKGTDIRIYVNRKRWFKDSGMMTGRKDFGNLPAGEAICMPAEGKTEGVFVVDGSIGGLGLVDSDVKITVKGGFANRVEGGKTAENLDKQLKTRMHRNIAEFAFGTNDKARVTGVTLEDEKALGTVHIALGNNRSYGGNVGVQYHSDCIIRKPDVYADGFLVMKCGKFCI